MRCDIQEILACKACDANLVRAPMGDKVVSGGAYGSSLVAKLVVGKYWDGMPLYRQGEELERLGLSMPSSSMSDQIMWAELDIDDDDGHDNMDHSAMPGMKR